MSGLVPFFINAMLEKERNEVFRLIRLKYELDTAGMTHEQLGESIGCHRVVVGRYVRGLEKPRHERAEAIAKALDWPPERAAELFEEIKEVR